MKVFVTLSSTVVIGADQDDYDSFVDYISANIDSHLPEYAPIDVDSYEYSDHDDHDILIDGTDNQELISKTTDKVKQTLNKLLEDWNGCK